MTDRPIKLERSAFGEFEASPPIDFGDDMKEVSGQQHLHAHQHQHEHKHQYAESERNDRDNSKSSGTRRLPSGVPFTFNVEINNVKKDIPCGPRAKAGDEADFEELDEVYTNVVEGRGAADWEVVQRIAGHCGKPPKYYVHMKSRFTDHAAGVIRFGYVYKSDIASKIDEALGTVRQMLGEDARKVQPWDDPGTRYVEMTKNPEFVTWFSRYVALLLVGTTKQLIVKSSTGRELDSELYSRGAIELKLMGVIVENWSILRDDLFERFF
jgi:hypothetical protein